MSAHSSPDDVVVRPAAPADMRAVGRLGALLVRIHHDFDPKRFVRATSHTARGYGDFLETQLDEPDVLVFVAERAGKVVGYTYSGIEGRDYMALRGPAGVVYDIIVDPKQRGRGVGLALLDRTIEALNERGAPQVVLSTAERNGTAQRLFERAGFRRTMIEMTRDLDSPSR